MKIDAIFEIIGDFGRYHQVLYVLVFACGIPNALVVMHLVYSNYEPEFHCKLPPRILDYSKESANTTTNLEEISEEILNYTIPIEVGDDGIPTRSQCRMYDRNYTADPSLWLDADNASEVDCIYGYSFEFEEGQISALSEFSMVCGNAWTAPLVTSLMQVGMASGTFCGILADRFGRRPVYLWSSALQVISTVFASLSWDIYSYAVSTFLLGCTELINFVVGFVLVAEVIAVRWRDFIAVSSFFSFAGGYCLVAGLGYLFPNWRHLLRAMAIVSGILYLPAFWLFPESARWLIIKGRTDEGVKELKKMAKMNKKDLNVDAFVKENVTDSEIEAEKKTASLKETLRILFISRIAPRCLTVCLTWVVTGLAYYGISMHSTNFSEDRHLNLLLAGASEFPALVGSYYLVKFIGRPRCGFWILILLGTTCICLPNMTAPELSVLKTIVAMIGKGCASASFYVTYFLSAETAPTLHRSSAVSVGSFCARFGAVSAPFIMIIGKTYPFLPNLIMGIAGFATATLCIFFVPETMGIPLPDTVEEAEQNQRIYGFRIYRSLAPTDRLEARRKAAS